MAISSSGAMDGGNSPIEGPWPTTWDEPSLRAWKCTTWIGTGTITGPPTWWQLPPKCTGSFTVIRGPATFADARVTGPRTATRVSTLAASAFGATDNLV